MAYPYAERLRGYREEVHFALDMGEGPSLRFARDRLAAMALTQAELEELSDLDETVIEEVIESDAMADYLLVDDPAQPPTRWWWHLGAIRAGTFPAEALPENLRVVYRPAPAASP